MAAFICDTESIKDMKINEGEPDEAEHRFNSETYTLSAGAVRMMLYRNGNFTMWRLKLSLIKMVYSSYEVDLAVLVVSDSSSSGK